MAYAVILFMIALLVIVGIRSRANALGIWLSVLMTHGIFVHFFGSLLQHLPFYMGLFVVPIAIISRSGIKFDFFPFVLLSIFFTLICISFFVNSGSDYSFQKIIVYAKPMFVCLIILACIRDINSMFLIAKYIVISVTVGGLFNIYQNFTGEYLNLNEWDHSLSRAAGLRLDPNDTAMLMLIAIPLIYYFSINSKVKVTKLTALISALITIFGIVLTGSRAGFAVMVFIGISLIFHNPENNKSKLLSWPSKKNLGIFLIGIIIVAIAAPSYYWERVYTLVSKEEVGQSQSLYHRYDLLIKGFELWKTNPIIGVGPGNFNEAFVSSDLGYTQELSQKTTTIVAHNMYIEILAEFGIIGFFVFLTICFFSLKNLFMLDRKKFLCDEKDQKYRFIGYAYGLSLMSMLLMGLTLSQGYNSVFWFIVGIALSAKKLSMPISLNDKN